MRSAFEASGEIRSVDLLAAFVTLWRERGSGTLSFHRPDAHAGFQIAAGEIVGVSSSEPRFETAAILVRAGRLDPGAIARVVVPEGGEEIHAPDVPGALEGGPHTVRGLCVCSDNSSEGSSRGRSATISSGES